jgi:GT2 family glycosyltransferase
MTSSERAPAVSVIVPTCARPQLLARCLDALLAQRTSRMFEVVVVDDGGGANVPQDPRVRMLTGGGRGPAHARNAGVRAAHAPIVLFTDDDTVPDAGWVEAAADALAAEPHAVGVEGPIHCAGWDPLYEIAVVSDGPGAYFTCNVGYRRDELVAAGGFDESFRHPHCEDVDLGLRMLERGPIVFAPAMRVVHPPRRVSFREIVRRGRLAESTWALYRKHPDRSPARWPDRWAPVIKTARMWQRRLTQQRIARGSPLRAARALALATAQTGLCLTVCLTRWERQR